MQVGEQHLVLAHPGVLLGDGLLDLADQIRLGPHVVGRSEDLRSRGDEVVIRDRRTGTGVLLHHDGMAADGELVHAGGRDGDAVLVVLDLARDPDSHGQPFPRGTCPGAV